jgi:predicted secreted hydrolase
MTRRWISPGFLLLVAVVAGGVLSSLRSRGPGPVRASLAVSAALAGGDTVGYARALEPRVFVFPEDHGPHPRFRTEWWYVTGNVETGGGRPFGFQLTLFRNALAPSKPELGSDWATNQVYMGHFALTDVRSEEFHHHERFARESLGLAGARSQPFRVWLEDWVMEGGDGEAFPLRLQAEEGEVAIDLLLDPVKPVVLQGDSGLSRKAPGPGNASYYYSFTRLTASGSVRVDGEELAVEGLAWIDREWSTSVLAEGESGWDWFALQLSDGRDIMYGRTRREDGSAGSFQEGVLVEPDGTYRVLRTGEVDLEKTAEWPSPLDGSIYPAGWSLSIPAEGVRLVVTPLVADQELNLAFRYWEGAVEVEGRTAAGPATGRGYVELTGYGGVAKPR